MKIKTIRFNFLMNLLLTASNFLFPLLTFPYVSRVLSPVGTGKVAFAYSLISYFTILASFGVSNYGIRAVAKVRDNKDKLSKTVQEILCITVVFMVIVYVLLFLSVIYVPELNAEKKLLFIASFQIVFTIIGLEWLYKGIEQYQYIAIRSIIFKFISFILIFICIKTKNDYMMYAFVLVFATAGSGIINILNLRKIIFIKKYRDYEFIIHMKPMLVFFISTVAVSIYVNFNIVLLGFISGDEEVGYYNAAYRIKDLMVSISTALGAVLLPRLSYYIENNMLQEFNRVISKTVQFILLFSLPLLIFCILFARPAILLLAGSEYEQSIILLQILSFIILIVGISNLTGIQMLIPLNQEKYFCYSLMFGAIINLLLNLLLIPKYNAIGAAISITITEMSIMCYQLFLLRKYIHIMFSEINWIKISIAIIVSVSIFFLYNKKILSNLTVMNFLASSSLFFISYFSSLIVLKDSFIYTVIKQVIKKF
ncbi:flippase [Gallibacterium anatis]|uniref:Polysaccharide biosynthesis protein n=2 Tax=Gallibacterium anatis TaxID=750 RepID=F4HEZ1_GALAU|nr:flippase [Gallibacterium anatis]AEC18151.1 Polysaccharide biosynthesis protein [Gallibacterium anatis UMN179]KGQ28351.1 flippase [Gallibacterium anatis]KGQ36275.1 flippase [Gallibacterium anatis]